MANFKVVGYHPQKGVNQNDLDRVKTVNRYRDAKVISKAMETSDAYRRKYKVIVC